MQYRRPPSLRTAAYQDRLWPMSRPHAVFERRFDGLAARQLVAGPVRHALEGALARGVGSAALRGGPARADRGRGRAHQRPDARHRPAPFRLPSTGIHTPRARQCPLARLPPRAAGPNPTGARGLLELATADVRAGRPARPGELPGAGDRCLRGDDARGRHRGRRIPLHPPRPGGPALRRPERDGPRPGGRGFEGGHPSHLDRHLLPPGRPQGSPARRPAAALRRRRRLHLGRAGREAPGWPDPADRRRHPQRAGAAPGRHAAGRVLGGGAVRSDGDASTWAERVGKLQAGPTLRIAAGIHSVRALHPGAMRQVASWAAERSAPLHLHLSEQRAENDECLAVTGLTPAALADRCGVLGPRTTAVHATWLSDDDIRRLGATRTAVCICATTERDLADGIGPAAALGGAGSPLCVGSDSNAVVDLFEEARAVELDERLATGRRGHHHPAALLAAASTGGMAAIGWRDAGRLQTGALADFATLDLGSPRLAGARPEDLIDHVVFAATAADVTHVVIGGRPVVEQRCHVALGDVGQALAKAIRALDEPQPVEPASRPIPQRPRT